MKPTRHVLAMPAGPRHLKTAALLCVLALITPTQLQATTVTSATVSVLSSDSVCQSGQPGTHLGIKASVFSLDTPSCSALAVGYVGAGELGVYSRASTAHVELQPPGYPERTPLVSASSSAMISERVHVATLHPAYLNVLGDDVWLFRTNFAATGTVDGGASDIILLWNSTITYDVSLGGDSRIGSKSNIGSRSGQNRIIQDTENNWGVQSLLVLWHPNQGPLLDFKLSATSYSEAVASGSGSPAGATAFAEADFSHTLRWLGISSFSAFRANGDAIDLAPDFVPDMIGEDSGFNYRFAAELPTDVPEPAEWMTLLTGIALSGIVMHRRSQKSRANPAEFAAGLKALRETTVGENAV